MPKVDCRRLAVGNAEGDKLAALDVRRQIGPVRFSFGEVACHV